MNFCTFWRLIFTKFTKFWAPKIAKTAFFELLDSLKMISHKIWMTEKSWNFHTLFLKYCIICFFDFRIQLIIRRPMKIPKPPKLFMMIDMSLIKRLELWLFTMPELLKIRPNTFAMLKIPKLKLWLLRLSVCERLQLWKRDPKMLFSRYVRDDSFYRPGQPNCEYTMWKF